MYNHDKPRKCCIGFADVASGVGGIGSAVSGVAGAISSAIASKRYLKGVRETNATNKELAEKQNQWNLDQWNRQNAYNEGRWDIENEYNSPAAQVARLKAAGLNPNMMSGNPSASGEVRADTLQSADLANQQAAGMSNPLSESAAANLSSGLLAMAQVRNLNADTEAKEARAGLDKTKQITELSNQKWIDKLAQSSLDYNNSRIEFNIKAGNEKDQNVINLRKSCDLLDKQIEDFNYRWAQIDANIRLKDKQIDEIGQRLDIEWRRLDISEQDAKYLRQMWQSMSAQAYASADLAGKQARGIDLDNMVKECTMIFEIEGIKFEAEMTKEGVVRVKNENRLTNRFGTLERATNIVSKFFSGLGIAIGAGFGAYKTFGKPKPGAPTYNPGPTSSNTYQVPAFRLGNP